MLDSEEFEGVKQAATIIIPIYLCAFVPLCLCAFVWKFLLTMVSLQTPVSPREEFLEKIFNVELQAVFLNAVHRSEKLLNEIPAICVRCQTG